MFVNIFIAAMFIVHFTVNSSLCQNDLMTIYIVAAIAIGVDFLLDGIK